MGDKYVGRTQVVGRTADSEAKTTDTELALDDVLQMPVIAGRTYHFEATIIADKPATGGVKIGLSTPADSTGRYFENDTPGTSVALNAAVNSTSADPELIALTGTFTAGADGTFGITWAQQASNAGETSLLAGSAIRLRNLD